MLSEAREMSYVPSLTLLARLLTTPRLVRTIERFVGFGDPDGSLSHVRPEIDHAASTFADTLTAFGDELHYHMVMANLADADVAHLGCHGVFFPSIPIFPPCTWLAQQIILKCSGTANSPDTSSTHA